MMEPEWIPEGAILTPHKREFVSLYLKSQISNLKTTTQISNLEEETKIFAKKFNCTVLLKGEKDIVASEEKIQIIEGLVAAFYTKNDPWTSAVSASYINKKSGEDLYKKMGLWFNASDLADQIPETMRSLLL